jgi:hypothetical protein
MSPGAEPTLSRHFAAPSESQDRAYWLSHSLMGPPARPLKRVARARRVKPCYSSDHSESSRLTTNLLSARLSGYLLRQPSRLLTTDRQVLLDALEAAAKNTAIERKSEKGERGC